MVYEYKCRDCETVSEIEHSINDSAEELGLTCPACGSEDIFKYLGNYGRPTIIFRGPGWVVNDTALERIGMPQAQQHSPEGREKLKEVI